MIEIILAGMAAATSSPSVSKELQPLAFLVGHCWRGEFGKGGPVDTHCFEPVFDGKFVRDRHEVTGGEGVYKGETLYNWNAEQKLTEYTYWNSIGGISRGTMTAKDGLLDFGSETHTAADGSKLSIATQWRPSGADAYDVVSIRNGVTGDRVVTYRRVD